MTMNYYHAVIDATTRQQQIQAEAEKHRLAQGHTEPTETTPPYAPLLAKAGERLVEFGHQLQERYGQAVEIPISPRPATDG